MPENAHRFTSAVAHDCRQSDELREHSQHKLGWVTYNFEVEDLHTYIAADIRVHNKSVTQYLPKGAEILSVGGTSKGYARDMVYVSADGAIVHVDGTSDKYGNTIRVKETITYGPDTGGGSGATVKYSVKYKDGHEVSRDVESIEIDHQYVQLGTIGNILGSQLGAVLGGNSLVGKVAAGTLVGTFAQNLGEVLHNTYRFSHRLDLGDAVNEAFTESFKDFGKELQVNLEGQVFGQLSSLLMTELADALNLEGFEGGLFTSMGMTVTNQIFTNVWTMAKTGTFTSEGLFRGFGPTQANPYGIFSNLAGAVGGFLGSYLASQIIIPDNKQAAYGTSIGASIGAYVGSLIPIPFLGTFIGAFIGNILGTVLGNAFGVDEKSWGSVYIDINRGKAVNGDYGAKNEGDSSTFEQVTSIQAQTVNYIVDRMGARIIGLNGKGNGRIDYYQKGTTYIVTMPDGRNFDFISRHTPNKDKVWADVSDKGIMKLLDNVKLEGGGTFEKLAYEKSKPKAGNSAQLVADIEVAKSYEMYLYDNKAINLLMKTAPKSPFATGWALTLLRANELGLDKVKTLDHRGEDDSDDKIRGTLLIDKSWGLGGADRIYGEAGNDVLYGGNGNDRIWGGNDDDVLNGEADDDRLQGQDGNDALLGGSGSDSLYGGAGNDKVSGESGDDLVDGGDGDDILDGGTWDDSLNGGNGNDTLIGGSGFDILRGGEGNDLLQGDAHDDLLKGEGGDDTLKGGAGLDELYGGLGNDTLDGGSDRDFLRGEAGDDVLTGGDGDDELNGGDGNDKLDGGNHEDWLAGGAGQDTLDGGSGGDMLLGGDDEDWLKGEGGNDTLEGGTGNDILEGGSGEDRMRGDQGNDTLYGHDGRDDLDGGAGHDELHGGDGADALLGADGNDTLKGGAGDDGLMGDGGDDRLYGEGGNDWLKGGEGADALYGDDGNDILYGGAGADTLQAGDGHDELYGDLGEDSLDGGLGSDKLWGGAGADLLDGGAGDDVLTGDAGDDTLRGGLGSDMLSGGAGNDYLDGGGGNDQIFGGQGNDIMIGGPDVDYVDGGAGTDTLMLSGGYSDYKIRFNTAIGRFSIVDLRAGSPDGTDLADIELFHFSNGVLTRAEIDYMIDVDTDLAWDIENSDGSKSTLGWRPWSADPAQIETFIQRRNLAGVVLSETIFRPDGTRSAYAKDVDDLEDWDAYVQTFDADANLVKQQFENDDFTRTVLEWDPVSELRPLGHEVWSTRQTKLVDVNGVYRETWQLDTLDEPEVDPSIVDYIEREWDRSETQGWDTIVREYDIYASGHWLIEDTTYDGGSRSRKGNDYVQDGYNYGSNRLPKEWNSFEERQDAAGNKYWESYTYYATGNEARHTIVNEWDYSGQNWSHSTLYMLSPTQPIWKELYYDAGQTYSKTKWDWHYTAGDWSERVTHYDGASREVWQEDQWISSDILVKGIIRQWDRPNAVTWAEYHQFYNYNSTTGAREFYRDTILYDNGEYAVINKDLYNQSTAYKSQMILYTDVTQRLVLRKETFLDRADSNNVILIVEATDQYERYSSWDHRLTKYKANPNQNDPEKYLPVSQVITVELGHRARFEKQWDYTRSVGWKYKVTAIDDLNRVTYEKTLYDGGNYKTIDYDVSNQGWSTIEQHYYAEQAGAQTYKKVNYDGGATVEEFWDPQDQDAVLTGEYGQWRYIYKEKNAAGTIVRHWYIDDIGGVHYLNQDNTSDDNESGTGWDHEPGDPATGADGGWGEADGNPFAPQATVTISPGLFADDFRHFG